MIWPFVIAAALFIFLVFRARGKKSLNLDTLRTLLEKYAVLCRAIATERIRVKTLDGDERAAVQAHIDAMERTRVEAEATALRLREALMRAGFGLGDARLTTVDEAEAELVAQGQAKR